MQNEKIDVEQKELNESDIAANDEAKKKTRAKWKLVYKIFKELLIVFTCVMVIVYTLLNLI